MPLSAQLEAILFFKGEALTFDELATMLRVDVAAVRSALHELQEALSTRGIRLILTETQAMLATSPEMSDRIDAIRKEELSQDLSRAAAETLSIVLYHGPVTRSDIDFIRGVNSTFVLRNLLTRGLIEKTSDPSDQRSFKYRPAVELLAQLGITRIEELPEFDKVRRALEAFIATEATENDNSANQD